MATNLALRLQPKLGISDLLSHCYEYKPLESGQIRLLSILGSSSKNEVQEEVEVSLTSVQLGTVGYDTVSYTWGPSTYEEEDYQKEQIFTQVVRCYPVFCEGKIIRVSKSLRDLLQALKTLAASKARNEELVNKHGLTRSTYIWADGICINQDDVVEREQQVSLMGTIYKSANIAFAYLGGESDHYLNTIDVTTKLDRLGKVSMQDELISSASVDASPDELWARISTDPPTGQQWHSFFELFTRPWFTRTWIVQEMMLPEQHRVITLCGQHIHPMSELLGGLTVYTMAMSLYIQGIEAVEDIEEHAVQRVTRRGWSKDSWRGAVHPYTEILQAGLDPNFNSFFRMSNTLLKPLDCMDPRDRVYATLECMPEWQDPQQPRLEVDYNTTADEVYCRASKHLVTYDVNMLSLVKLRGRSRVKGLASWCIDFDDEECEPRNLMQHRSKTQFCAAGLQQKQVSVRQSLSRHLNLFAVQCDTVVNTSTDLDSFWIDSGTIGPLLDWLLRWEKACSVQMRHENSMSILHRVLCTQGWLILPEPKPPEHLESAAGMGVNLTFQIYNFLWEVEERYAAISNEIEQWKRVLALLLKFTLSQPSPSVSCLPDLDALFDIVKLREQAMHAPQDWEAWKSKAQARMLELMLTSGIHLKPHDHALFASTLNSKVDHRKLFWTERGSLGMTHQTVQAGDEIWLVQGAVVPFVFRKVDNGHRTLIGETYVDGMMFGERWPSDGKGLQVVTLE